MGFTLGEKIKGLRKKMGLTLEQLGKMTGSSKSYIWELENKSPPRPSAEKIDKIADALGVTSAFLLDEKSQSPTPDVVDQAFFRKYSRMPKETKIRISKILDVWEDDK